jgi:hypothetical protein
MAVPKPNPQSHKTGITNFIRKVWADEMVRGTQTA